MAYLEVKKNGQVIIRRQLDDAEAAKGCSVNLGPDKTVKLSTGQSATEGDFEAQILPGDDPSADQNTGTPLPHRRQPTASDKAALDVTVDADDADDDNSLAADLDVTDDEADAPAPTAPAPTAVPKNAAGSFEAQMSQTLDPDTGAPSIEGYQIKRQLGEGAMGQVWHAVQLSTHREVALKFMGKGKFASEKARLRFEREVELAARLEHPNIARVYDSGLHHGGYFYAMELILGKDLDKYVSDKKLSRRQILELMRTICQAVQHAHQRGVIHRDLKPGNIMVNDEGKSFVVDFGLAKTLLEDEDPQLNISQDGESTGTPAYMSPEQAAGRLDEIDVRTDVYSLGVILYRLLTGEVPHELKGSRFEFIRRVVEEEVRRPRDVCKDVDAELEALLLKALAQEPANRYSSAGDLADDITNYLTGEPLTARKATTAYFLKKRFRKHRTAVIIAAAVVLMLIGTAAYSYVNVRAERAEAIKQRAIAEVARGEAVEQRNKAVDFAQQLKAKQDEVIRERDNAKQAQAQAELAERKAVTARDKAARALYANQIARVQTELRQFNVSIARDVLAQCDTDLRHWEWYRLTRLGDQSSRTLAGGDKGTAAVAFGPDDKNMAAVSFDGIVQSWDWPAGKKGKTVKTSARQVVAVGFSSDAGRLVVSGVTSGVSIWDIGAGKQIAALKPAGDAMVFCAAMSPSGDIAVTGGDGGRIDLWDGATGSAVRSLTTSGTDATAVAFDRKGAIVAAGCKDGRIFLWSAKDGQLRQTHGHGAEVTSLGFSPDGKQLVSGGSDGRLKVWNTDVGRLTGTIPGHAGRVSAATFSADSKRIISGGSDRILRVWDASTGTAIASLMGHSAAVAAVAVSSDGKWLVSGGSDKPLRIWDARGGYATTTLSTGSAVKTVACSPTDDLVASVGQGAGGGLLLWNCVTGLRERADKPLTGAENGVAFLPDGKRMAGAGQDGRVTIFDAATGKKISTITAHLGAVTCVATGGKWIASGGRNDVKIWDSATTDKPKWTFPIDTAQCAAVSADGRYVAAAGRDKTVYLWDLSTDKVVAKQLKIEDHVAAVAFSPDGRTVITGSWDGSLRIWNTSDGKLIATLSGHTGAVLALAVSSDGRRIISASADKTLKIWDTVTGAAMLTLDGHEGQVTSVSITADGRRVVSGSLDQTVRLWDSAVRKNR